MTELTSSPPTDRVEERAIRKAALLFFALTVVFWVVSALSRATENRRVGLDVSWDIPWLLEGSSLLITALLFFAVAWWESLWPVSPGRVPAKVIAHLVGSLAFSATHIVAMVAIRELYFHIVHNIDYTYIRNGFEDILYDYRKDSVTYITMLMLIYLTRGLEITRQEAVRDLQMASDEKRLALKCGGSTIFLAADKVEAVQGDGNYVFIHTASESFHARMTLIEAEKLLRSSGQSVIRVHKSWIIDREKIERISKNDKGDPIYQLRGKRIIKGSRRYRI